MTTKRNRCLFFVFSVMLFVMALGVFALTAPAQTTARAIDVVGSPYPEDDTIWVTYVDFWDVDMYFTATVDGVPYRFAADEPVLEVPSGQDPCSKIAFEMFDAPYGDPITSAYTTLKNTIFKGHGRSFSSDPLSDVPTEAGDYTVVLWLDYFGGTYTFAAVYVTITEESTPEPVFPITLTLSAENFVGEWGKWTLPEPILPEGKDLTFQWKYLAGEEAATLPDNRILPVGTYSVWGELGGSDAADYELRLKVGEQPVTRETPAAFTVSKAKIGAKNYADALFDGAVYGEGASWAFFGEEANGWLDEAKPTGADASILWYYVDAESGVQVPVTIDLDAGVYELYCDLAGSHAAYLDCTITHGGNPFPVLLTVQPKVITDVCFYYQETQELLTYTGSEEATNDLFYRPDGFSLSARSASFPEVVVIVGGWKTDPSDEEEEAMTLIGNATGVYYAVDLGTEDPNYKVDAALRCKVAVRPRILLFTYQTDLTYTGAAVKPSFDWAVLSDADYLNPDESAEEVEALLESEDLFTEADVEGIVIGVNRGSYKFGVQLVDKENYRLCVEGEFRADMVWTYVIHPAFATIALEQKADWYYAESVTEIAAKVTVTVTTNLREDAPAGDLCADDESPIVKGALTEWSVDGEAWIKGLPSATEIPDPGEQLGIRVVTPESASGNYAETTSDPLWFTIRKAAIYAVFDRTEPYSVGGDGAPVGPESAPDVGREVKFHLFTEDGPDLFTYLPATFDPLGTYDVDLYDPALREGFLGSLEGDFQTLWAGDFSYYYTISSSLDPKDGAKKLSERFIMDESTSLVAWRACQGVVATEKLDLLVKEFVYGGGTEGGCAYYQKPALNFTGKIWDGEKEADATDPVLGVIGGFAEGLSILHRIPYRVDWEFTTVSSPAEEDWTAWTEEGFPKNVGVYLLRCTAYFAMPKEGAVVDWSDPSCPTVTGKFDPSKPTFTARLTGGVFEIKPKSITLVWSDLTHTYDACAHKATLSATLCYDEAFADVIAYNDTAYTDYAADGYPLTASTKSANYTIQKPSATLWIDKAVLTVTPYDYAEGCFYGDAAPDYGYSITGFLEKQGDTQYDKRKNLERISRLTGAPVISCAYRRFDDAGSYAISITQDTLWALNYDFDCSATATLVVAPKPITVTLFYSETIYGDSFKGLQSKMDGVLPKDAEKEIYRLGVYTVSEGVASAVAISEVSHAGTYYVLGECADGNYDVDWVADHAVTVGDRTVKATTYLVARAPLTVTPDDGQTKKYQEPDPDGYTYTVAGQKNGETPVFNRDELTAREEGEEEGEYEILQGDLALTEDAVNQNYYVVFVSGVKFGIGIEYVDMSSIAFSDRTVTYDGSLQGLSVEGDLESLPGGVTVDYYLTDSTHAKTETLFEGAAHVGVYYVEARFSVSVVGYKTPSSAYAILTVTQREAAVGWSLSADGYRYSGKEQAYPAATATYRLNDLDETLYSIPLSVVITSGQSAFLAAGNYRFEATTADGDYRLTGGVREVEMQKKTLTVLWESAAEYAGGVQKPMPRSLDGVCEGDDLSVLCDQSPVGVGSWKNALTFSLIGKDKDNYACDAYGIDLYEITPRILVLVWQEKAGEYYEYLYDGDYHLPVVTVGNAVAGEEVELVWTSGARRSVAGEAPQKVSVDLTVLKGKDAGNYKMPQEALGVTYDYLRITRSEVSVLWSDLTATYDGEVKYPTALIDNKKTDPLNQNAADEVSVGFKSGAVNAGEYDFTEPLLTLLGKDADNYRFKAGEKVRLVIAPCEVVPVFKLDGGPFFSVQYGGKNRSHEITAAAVGCKDDVITFPLANAVQAEVYSGTVTVLAGRYSADGDQGGNNNYCVGVDYAQAWSITQAPLTVWVEEVAQIVYGDALPAFGFGVTGLKGTDKVQDALSAWQATYLCDYAAGKGAGDYPVALDPKGFSSKNYALTFEGALLQVEPKTVSIGFFSGGNRSAVYGDEGSWALLTDPYELLAWEGIGADSVREIVTVAFREEGAEQTVALADFTFESRAVGRYRLVVTDKGVNAHPNYHVRALPVNTTDEAYYQVTPARLSVSLTLSDGKYGTPLAAPTLDAGISTSGWKGVDGNALIGKENMTLKYAPIEVFGEIKTAKELSDEGLLESEAWSALDFPVAAGTYYAFVEIFGLQNYGYAYDVATVTIAKATLFVRAEDKTVIYGDPVPTFTVRCEGFVYGQDESVLDGALVFACNYTPTSSAAFSYAITARGYQSDDYDLIFASGRVTVLPRSVRVSFVSDLKQITYGDRSAWEDYLFEVTAKDAFWRLATLDDTGNEVESLGADKIGDLVKIELRNASNKAVLPAHTLPVGRYFWVVTELKNPNYVLLDPAPAQIEIPVGSDAREFRFEGAAVAVTPAELACEITLRDVTYGSDFQAPTLRDSIVFYEGSWRFDGDAALLTEDNVTVRYAAISKGKTLEEIQGDPSAFTDSIPTDAGSYAVLVCIFDLPNYADAAFLSRFEILPKEIEVTVVAKSAVYGSEQVALEGVVLQGAVVAGDETPYRLSCEVGVDTPVGKYDVTGVCTNGNYAITFVDDREAYEVTAAQLTDVSVGQVDVLTYNKSQQVATVAATATPVNGAAVDPVTFTYSLAEEGDYSLELPAFTAAGVYTVYYKANAANHFEARGSFPVTIRKADPKIDLGGMLIEVKYTGAPITFDGAISEATTDPSEGELVYENNVQTAVGSYTIKVTYLETANYIAAEKTLFVKIAEAETVIVKNADGEAQTATSYKDISEDAAATAEGVSIKDAVAEVYRAAVENDVPAATLEVKIGESATVRFDKAALEKLASAEEVKITYVQTQKEEVDRTDDSLKNAELVLELSLSGVTFTGGKATVSALFENKAPNGKKAVVYYVDEEGNKTDMNATFEDGFVTFETAHFSTYVVEYVMTQTTVIAIIAACIVGLSCLVVAILMIVKRKKKGDGNK